MTRQQAKTISRSGLARIDLDAKPPDLLAVQSDAGDAAAEARDAAANARDQSADARDSRATGHPGDQAALDRAIAARDRLSAALDRWGAALDRQQAADRDHIAREVAAKLADAWWKRISAMAAAFGTAEDGINEVLGPKRRSSRPATNKGHAKSTSRHRSAG
jgi:hypothetical protein